MEEDYASVEEAKQLEQASKGVRNISEGLPFHCVVLACLLVCLPTCCVPLDIVQFHLISIFLKLA
eukprot:589824-Amphidinium_carterae.1